MSTARRVSFFTAPSRKVTDPKVLAERAEKARKRDAEYMRRWRLPKQIAKLEATLAQKRAELAALETESSQGASK